MNKNTERLLLISIILIFIALRTALITQKNLWFDEIFSWNLTLGTFHDIIIRTSLDIHPPLYYFVLKIWNSVFGDSVFSMRMLSALFSGLSLVFIYPLSKRVLSPLNCIMALILFAFNPLNIFYSQEVRMSAMNLFLNAGSVYFFLNMFDKNQLRKGYFRKPGVYLYIIFTASALYTHYFSFFIFIVEIIIFVLRLREARPIKSFAVAIAAIILLYLPWIPTLIEHASRGQTWRYGLVIHTPLKELVNFIKDINLGLYYHYTNLDFIHIITIFLILCYALAFILSIKIIFRKEFWGKQNKDNKTFDTAIVPALLIIIPVGFAMILSLKQRIEFYRYLSIIIPFIIILFVYGISKINIKYISTILIIIFLAINIYGLTVQYSFNFKNDDYRDLINHVEKKYTAGDRMYVEPHYMGWSIGYYKKQWDLKLPNPAFIRYGWHEIEDSIKVQNPERFWLVLDYSAVDTSKYDGYINELSISYKADEIKTYYIAPNKVELYMYRKK